MRDTVQGQDGIRNAGCRMLVHRSSLRRLALLLLVLATVGLPAADGLAKDRFVVYLLVGHSNMAGRGLQPDRETHPRCWEFKPFARKKEEPWQLAVDNVKYKRKARSSVKMPLLKGLAAAHPDRYFGCVPFGISAGMIDKHFRRGKKEYGKLVRAAKEVQQVGVIGGVFTMFGIGAGEDDGGAGFEAHYRAMAAELREDLGRPDLPIVMTTLAQYFPDSHNVANTAAAIERLAGADANLIRLDASGISQMDAVHYDTPGQHEWARRALALVEQYPQLVPDLPAAGPMPASFAARLQGKAPLAAGAGGGDAAGASAQVVARLQRLSPKLRRSDVHPYDDALLCAEFTVLDTQAGDLATDTTIFVVLPSMRDGKNLMRIRPRTGQRYALDLEAWSQKKDLHQLPLSDEVSTPADELWYAEEAKRQR